MLAGTEDDDVKPTLPFSIGKEMIDAPLDEPLPASKFLGTLRSAKSRIVLQESRAALLQRVLYDRRELCLILQRWSSPVRKSFPVNVPPDSLGQAFRMHAPPGLIYLARVGFGRRFPVRGRLPPFLKRRIR